MQGQEERGHDCKCEQQRTQGLESGESSESGDVTTPVLAERVAWL